ncbi:MAG: hypothetical protein H0T89_24035 [Deltaproteobacteria bacterium]|nr:hypothetical protein [Deltaproteobacteria bacterium]MDQ3299984.1 hypothetical protein [Myxococcota bacterium]
MRSLIRLAIVLVVACGDNGTAPPDDERVGTETYPFGPFTVAPGEEVIDDCVQITLGNTDYVYVNAVELTTGPGFHHSNWFFVPEFAFPGVDGTYKCDDRDFDQAVAAIHGGVLFAQSTQTPNETQQFPQGVVIKIPPRSKIVTQIHLLNPTDNTLQLTPDIKVTYVRAAEVTTTLTGVSFQNAALALPPNMASRFSVECDLAPKHEMLIGRPVDFKLYYALAHYHELGTGLSVEAVKPDGTTRAIYSTQSAVGEPLGGVLDPQFDMAGFTKLRFSCDFYNPRSTTVRWGVGEQEMCVFLAFSDSTYNWGGGVLERQPPQNPVLVGDTMTYTNPCVVFATDGSR